MMLIFCSFAKSKSSINTLVWQLDSLTNKTSKEDSLKPAVVKVDTVKISKNAIDEQVKYQALDSIIFVVDSQLVFLYGKAEVYYGDVNLKAGEISIDQQKNLVKAQGVLDSTGKKVEKPTIE